MSKQTMEQRWKAVGVEREEVAKLVSGRGVDIDWDIAVGWERAMYQRTADGLLPLIEEAVRRAEKGARLDEHLCYCSTCREGFRERCGRFAQLEAGND